MNSTPRLELLLNLPLEQKRKALTILRQKNKLKKARSYDKYYPDNGPLRRELYPKHQGFFEAGAWARERLFLAANRVGKTEGVGGYELTLHLTGLYPEWWTGRRFDRPIRAWTANETNITTRDINQLKLLGPYDSVGTGLIPGRLLDGRPSPKPGVQEAFEIARVKHVSGGTSILKFKSYEQKRKSFQGTEQDVIWLDEECPLDIYAECLIRTMTTGGMILGTFTPLLGL